ncbi:MAG: GNAT family N-acetyltransferase [Chitinophagaceae bacterium]|nr:GNAT family N-acetyltransferase [Chitinophagaceae bacterium]
MEVIKIDIFSRLKSRRDDINKDQNPEGVILKRTVNAVTNHIIFETERLFIRPYTMDDLDNFFGLNGDEEVMRYIRPAKTMEECREFLQTIIAAYTERPGIGRWGMFAKDQNEFIGSFAVIPVEKSDKVQLGYALLKENWGKGYASESVKGGIQYAFDTLGLKEIAGITFPENIPSQNVLLKNGFVFDSMITEDGKPLHLYMLRRLA